VVTDSDCPNPIVSVTRTWTVTDLCGNVSLTCEQIITVVDNTAPVIACPADVLGIPGCDETAITALSAGFAFSTTPVDVTGAEFITAGGTITEACGVMKATYVDVVTDSDCPNPIVSVTRTWTVTDLCGNVSLTCEQIITVVDNTAPVIACPADVLGIPGCDETAITALSAGFAFSTTPVDVTGAEFITAGGTITEACGVTKATYVDVVTDSDCPNPIVSVTRTWTVTDLCGNVSIECDQTITVVDNTIPALSAVPADAPAECDDMAASSIWNNTGTPAIAAQDNTNPIELGVKFQSLVPGKISAVRIYKNWAGTETLTANLYDYPGGTLLGTGNANISGTGWQQINLNTPVSIGAGVTYVASVLTPNGNYPFTNAYFQSSDYNNPPLRALQNGEDGPNGVYAYGGGYPTSTFNGSNYWVDPVLLSPIPAAPVTASDACGTTTITATGSVAPGACPNAYTLTRTWTAEDECGNKSTATQIITVTDDTPPNATAPNGSDLECSTDLPPAVTTIAQFLALTGASASDNCSATNNLTVTSSTGTLQGSNCNGTIKREYMITDECGNTTTVTQTFTVTDNTAPNAATPTGDDLECSTDMPLAVTNIADFINLPGAGASDNCTAQANLVVSHLDGPLVGDECNGTIKREYMITDACGNTTTVTQTFTVTDDTNPSPTCNDITVELDNNGEYSLDQTDVEEIANGSFDNCTDVADLDLSVVPTDFDCSHIGTPQTVTLTVTDDCGNFETCDAEVTVEDNLPPDLTCPADINLNTLPGECSAEAAWDTPLQTDNCGVATAVYTAPGITIVDPGTGHGISGEFPLGETVVTLTVTDVNGNTATCTFTVTVTDNQPPMAMCAGPLMINLEPNGEKQLSVADIDAPGTDDNCGICFKGISRPPCGAPCSGPTVMLTCADLTTDYGYGPGVVPVTLTIRDCALPPNEATCVALVTVKDNQTPSVASCPADIVKNTDPGMCTAVVNYTPPTFIDGCGNPHPGVLQNPLHIPGYAFPTGNTTVTYSYTSSEGVTLYCNFLVTVVDNQLPSLTCPADLTATCDAAEKPVYADWAAFTAALGSGSDNCSLNIGTFILENETDNGLSCPKTITRVYRVADLSGNTKTCAQKVVVDDNTDPVVTLNGAASIQICQGGIWVDPGATADDNCSGNLSVNIVVTGS
ncbi:MAG: DUF4082 domain-containing protein, partial [Thermoanaerobaculia bacterium]|nr:DUF4082 domain-containing protein [Thermoanaerobaculia bacterium]